MPTITTWMRLEPRTRNVNMKAGLQARIYDPLWLLARQWQVGEFQGEDNGSPAVARWQGEAARLTRYHAGPLGDQPSVAGVAFDAGAVPLETLVEREPVASQGARAKRLRFAAEAGQQFLRMLDRQATSKNYRNVFKSQFAFAPLTAAEREALDAESLNFLDLVMPRVPDGRRLYAAMTAALRPAPPAKPALPAGLQIAQPDVAEVRLAAELWLDWTESLFSEPGAGESAWRPERMEYGFALAAPTGAGERVLAAEEYTSGRIDWQDFDVKPGASLGVSADAAAEPIARTTIPAPVTYRGMPAARFWEFEDARVDFGAIDAGPEDLARMLLVEFAMTYGNDWFVIPVELPVGSLCRTRSLVVTNTFGERTLIRSSNDAGGRFAGWRMFQLSTARAPGSAIAVEDANLFFLAPALANTLESRPVEEVMFLRDEMANMAWGVERVIESATERPLNRARESGAIRQPPADRGRETLVYRLATEVPDYWIPLLPVRRSDGLRLARGAVLKADGSQQVVQALGRILNPGPPGHDTLAIYEEEVPREGVRVTRSYQLVRWQDGSTHLWIGRQKRVGRGEGSSGLRFDSVEP